MDPTKSSVKPQETFLLDAYKLVLEDLVRVTGYPVMFSRVRKSSAPRWPVEPQVEEGFARFGLPGPGNLRTIAYLYFPDEAEQDPFARKCIDRFTGFAERMGRTTASMYPRAP